MNSSDKAFTICLAAVLATVFAVSWILADPDPQIECIRAHGRYVRGVCEPVCGRATE